MNSEYEPYVGPFDGRCDYTYKSAQRLGECIAQVGRVITQEGLVGALVLSYKKGVFKVRLQDGTIINGAWANPWRDVVEPDGISSNGWHIGDIKPIWDEDDIPF